MATIKVEENRIEFNYRITLTDGRTYTLLASPLQPTVASNIYGNVTENYTMVCFVSPPSYPYPLLQGIIPDPQYLQSKMGLDPQTADLLSAIASTLTLNTPADLILEAVENWEKGQAP